MRFLVELYLAPEDANPAAAARAVGDTSTSVVESIDLPADETCFLVVEAGTELEVLGLMQRAGLRVNRVSVAVTDR